MRFSTVSVDVSKMCLRLERVTSDRRRPFLFNGSFSASLTDLYFEIEQSEFFHDYCKELPFMKHEVQKTRTEPKIRLRRTEPNRGLSNFGSVRVRFKPHTPNIYG